MGKLIEWENMMVEKVEITETCFGKTVRGVVRDMTLPDIAENRLKWAVEVEDKTDKKDYMIGVWPSDLGRRL